EQRVALGRIERSHVLQRCAGPGGTQRQRAQRVHVGVFQIDSRRHCRGGTHHRRHLEPNVERATEALDDARSREVGSLPLVSFSSLLCSLCLAFDLAGTGATPQPLYSPVHSPWLTTTCGIGSLPSSAPANSSASRPSAIPSSRSPRSPTASPSARRPAPRCSLKTLRDTRACLSLLISLAPRGACAWRLAWTHSTRSPSVSAASWK